MRLTHRLRAAHDAILVGIGTVLADNPLLTVRLVDGVNPQPVILDSKLHFPSEANLLHNPGLSPWIATTEGTDPERQAVLEAAGARLLRFPANELGRVPLPALLACLADLGINSLMVEGGASVITAFLSQHLVDLIILTIAPVMVGGLRAPKVFITSQPRLRDLGYERVGDDLIIWGKPRYSSNQDSRNDYKPHL
jgi:3,4-dihydroxy 2-butanone 4-phosphate synthase/GTP cyclohydrolase II